MHEHKSTHLLRGRPYRLRRYRKGVCAPREGVWNESLSPSLLHFVKTEKGRVLESKVEGWEGDESKKEKEAKEEEMDQIA